MSFNGGLDIEDVVHIYYEILLSHNVTDQTRAEGGWGMGMIYYYRMDPPLCSGIHPRTRFALSATRERHLSMPEIGKKERDYLFKRLYRLRVMN